MKQGELAKQYKAQRAWLGTKERQYIRFCRARLIAENGKICAICGKPIEDDEDITVDHILPRALGGSTTYDNLQLAHRLCNLRKGKTY